MTTKQAIFEAIEQLPEQHQEDVLRYVQLKSLQFRSFKPKMSRIKFLHQIIYK